MAADPLPGLPVLAIAHLAEDLFLPAYLAEEVERPVRQIDRAGLGERRPIAEVTRAEAPRLQPGAPLNHRAKHVELKGA